MQNKEKIVSHKFNSQLTRFFFIYKSNMLELISNELMK